MRHAFGSDRRLFILLLALGWMGLAALSGAAGGPGAALATGSAPFALHVDGLDSLSNATLGQALEYLHIRPEELGFDKLYAEDDTFRLAIVEEILNDPLRLPGWQKQTVARLHDVAWNPIALTRLLGELIEAPDSRPAPERGLSQQSVPAPSPALSRDATPQAILAPTIERFIAQCRDADAALQTAFARFDPALKSKLLMAAPAFWGEATDPLD
jgi:hypothetical protein